MSTFWSLFTIIQSTTVTSHPTKLIKQLNWHQWHLFRLLQNWSKLSQRAKYTKWYVAFCIFQANNGRHEYMALWERSSENNKSKTKQWTRTFEYQYVDRVDQKSQKILGPAFSNSTNQQIIHRFSFVHCH